VHPSSAPCAQQVLKPQPFRPAGAKTIDQFVTEKKRGNMLSPLPVPVDARIWRWASSKSLPSTATRQAGGSREPESAIN
jgi:hypothetical protein